MRRNPKYLFTFFITVTAFFFIGNNAAAQYAANDTITSYAVIYNGDTIEAKTLSPVYHKTRETKYQANRRAEWTRLRNAIYVTYPYAKKAGVVMNDINKKLANVTDKAQRKKYIKTREKELKKEFADPLMNLSVYQGKVLMKLINRETGNNCYEIVKEYKGGAVARFYQTVAFFFGSNLKQPYDINGDEKEMEKIVIEVERMYGYRS
ncbi:MAG TPA: DUF4294 domain-containing protein [Ferruginibacter sp.]|nr:DUF4294 domain-containing protein [Ferruginibacter sp.]HPH91841.1 DUF4294 domain-containing protein [Ferruginibacter sp.]